MLCYNLLKRMILFENYKDKIEMQNRINGFYQKKKITLTQKNELERLLNLSNTKN